MVLCILACKKGRIKKGGSGGKLCKVRVELGEINTTISSIISFTLLIAHLLIGLAP